jgi:hypothetical protein
MTKASYFGLQNQIVDFHHGLLRQVMRNDLRVFTESEGCN